MSMRKLEKTFTFVDTEEQAKQLCESIKQEQSYYRRKHHKPSYTSWSSSDQKEHKFVVWHLRGEGI